MSTVVTAVAPEEMSTSVLFPSPAGSELLFHHTETLFRQDEESSQGKVKILDVDQRQV